MNSYFKHILILLLIQQYSFSQVSDIYEKVYYNTLAYDSISAQHSIKDQEILIVRLLSYTTVASPILNDDENRIIEDRFGFEYRYEYSDLPSDYLYKKQQAHNKTVYKHLDSIHGFSVENEIINETIRLLRMRSSKPTDRELKKEINKNFRRLDKALRDSVIMADVNYFNDNYSEAYQQYESVFFMLNTEKGKEYIYNSRYHSLMNMRLYNRAMALRERDTCNWIDPLHK